MIEIDFDSRLESRAEYIAQLVCDRASMHSHTIENGIDIKRIDLKSCAQTPQNLYFSAL